MREYFTQVSYLIAAVLFILGLRSLTRPDRARQGMQMAAVGMLFAICGTLVNHEIVDYRWIAGGLVLGTIIGPVNVAATVPFHASQMFGKNVLALVTHLSTKEGALSIDPTDEITGAMTVVRDGSVVART